MSHYILIDNASGYIWSDTRDLKGWSNSEWTNSNGGPIAACRMTDQFLGEFGRTYEEANLNSNECGYHVYQVDVRGSEALPVCDNGQSQELIKAVERDCEHVATIKCTQAEA